MKFIKEDDIRYQYLDRLYQNYNKDSFYIGEGLSIRYFIPPELVLNPIQGKIWVTDDINDPNLTKPETKLNWVHRAHIERVVNYTCQLSLEAYFNLLVLHNNESDNTPKCSNPECGKKLIFHKLSHGYGGDTTWKYQSEFHWYCDINCRAIGRYYYDGYEAWANAGYEALQQVYSKANASYSSFVSKGESDPAVFYITLLDNGDIKYGITRSMGFRHSFTRMDGGYHYVNPHIIIKGTAKYVADIEWYVKEKLQDYHEYLPYSKLHQLISVIKEILKDHKD